jgi:hypothetical protein
MSGALSLCACSRYLWQAAANLAWTRFKSLMHVTAIMDGKVVFIGPLNAPAAFIYPSQPIVAKQLWTWLAA